MKNHIFICLQFYPFLLLPESVLTHFSTLSVFAFLTLLIAPLSCRNSKIIQPNLSPSQTVFAFLTFSLPPLSVGLQKLFNQTYHLHSLLDGKFYYEKIIFGVPLWHSTTPTWFGILKKDFDYFHFGPQEICHAKFRGSSCNSVGVHRVRTNRQTDRQTLGNI